MPIYTFQCEECGFVTERLRSLEHLDEPLMCGECGGECIRVMRNDESKNTKKD